MDTAPAFASAGEAMDMVQAGLSYLAAADAAQLAAETQAECLRGLEQAMRSPRRRERRSCPRSLSVMGIRPMLSVRCSYSGQPVCQLEQRSRSAASITR